VLGPCDHGNESLVFIKGGKCFDQVSDYRHFNKVSMLYRGIML
jgi:hypothetical protein